MKLRSRMRGLRRSAALAGSLLALGLPGAADQPDADAETRATMDDIFAAIRFVLPLSLSDAGFQDPERRDEILAALDALAANGSRLEQHGRGSDAGFRFLSRSLARDTREIRDRYAQGRIGEARFLLHELTDDCVACHSRLPSDREFPLGERFVREESIAALPLEERATLEMATRQFDRALATYEALFASSETSPANLDLRGHFDDYLEVSLRVRGDFERPAGVFQAFLARDDLSDSLRGNMKSWVAALRTLGAQPPQGSPLEQARALIAAAERKRRYPNDRRSLVEYVAASSVLHRYVAAAGEPEPEVGEAYYLLGVIESRIGRTFWLSQTEHFLETAIRLGPSQPYAQKAYALLEEFVQSSYTGPSTAEVPENVRQRLDQLKLLIDRS